jgi:clan AA aspartic protease
MVPENADVRKGKKTNFTNQKKSFMGCVHAEIELINGEDELLARRHVIGEEEVKRTGIKMLVDSGAYMMAINENIQAYLNLPFQYKEPAVLADGRVMECDVVGPVEVRFANRRATCSAFVLPGDSEPLLGAIPMEQMDVLIDPRRQELIVNPKHPDAAMHRL